MQLKIFSPLNHNLFVYVIINVYLQTLEELDSHPDFQLLLLDKNTAIEQLAQSSSRKHSNAKDNNDNINMKIKKKEKMKMRRELLEKKIHVIKLLKKEEKGM